MLKCNECGEVFEEASLSRGEQVECGGALVRLADEPYCPHCGGEDMEEATLCHRCGEWFADRALESGFCAACGGELMAQLQKAMAQFTGRERDYLNWATEGVRL